MLASCTFIFGVCIFVGAQFVEGQCTLLFTPPSSYTVLPSLLDSRDCSMCNPLPFHHHLSRFFVSPGIASPFLARASDHLRCLVSCFECPAWVHPFSCRPVHEHIAAKHCTD